MPQPTEPDPAAPAFAPPDPVPPGANRRGRLAAVAVIALVLGCAAVLYGMRSGGKETAAACAGTAATVARLGPLARGEVAAFTLDTAPKPMAALHFEGGDAVAKTLADFKGKTVLLNLWATWCVPCRKEMPALDRLEAARGGPDFQVVAINVDTAGLDRPRRFLADAGIAALPFYADPAGRVLPTLYQHAAVTGLPTTFLLDRNGCTLGTVAGPADWSSADAKALIDAAKS